jgi:hypothetical protein
MTKGIFRLEPVSADVCLEAIAKWVSLLGEAGSLLLLIGRGPGKGSQGRTSRIKPAQIQPSFQLFLKAGLIRKQCMSMNPGLS